MRKLLRRDLNAAANSWTTRQWLPSKKGLFGSGNNFSVHKNPGPGSLGNWHLYYLYAVERVGRMTSHRFFNSRDFKRYDWYRMGAEQLVRAARWPERLLEGGWPCGNHAANQHEFCASCFWRKDAGRCSSPKPAMDRPTIGIGIAPIWRI